MLPNKVLMYYKSPKSLHLSLYMDEITWIMKHENSALYELKHLRIPLTWALLVKQTVYLQNTKVWKTPHVTWNSGRIVQLVFYIITLTFPYNAITDILIPSQTTQAAYCQAASKKIEADKAKLKITSRELLLQLGIN